VHKPSAQHGSVHHGYEVEQSTLRVLLFDLSMNSFIVVLFVFFYGSAALVDQCLLIVEVSRSLLDVHTFGRTPLNE
jgi:hypothetical protein